jgi:hypothetical protein
MLNSSEGALACFSPRGEGAPQLIETARPLGELRRDKPDTQRMNHSGDETCKRYARHDRGSDRERARAASRRPPALPRSLGTASCRRTATMGRCRPGFAEIAAIERGHASAAVCLPCAPRASLPGAVDPTLPYRRATASAIAAGVSGTRHRPRILRCRSTSRAVAEPGAQLPLRAGAGAAAPSCVPNGSEGTAAEN